MKRDILQLALFFGLFSICSLASGQTSTWNGSSWSNGAPSSSTGSYTFYVTGGTNCSIGDANMTALYIQNNGTKCTIASGSTVTSTSVIIQNGSNNPVLTVSGTLDVINLTINGFLSGGGTVNISAGTYAQASTGGIYPSLTNLNILSGSVNLSYYFDLQNLTVSNGATCSISNASYTPGPSVTGTLTLNGSLINYFAQSGTFGVPIYFTVNNLIINSGGSYNSSSGYTSISQSFKIGGTIAAAGSTNSYYYNFDNAGSANELDILGSANVKFSDLSYSDPSFIYLGTLNISGTAKFTVDKNLTDSTATINSGGTLLTSGSPTLTINKAVNINSGGTLLTSGSPTLEVTTINPVQGSFIVPGATLNYTPGTLTLSGSHSAIAYLNQPSMTVTLAGTNDTIRNCAIQKLTVSAGAKGYVNTSLKSYKIKNIDASDSVYIQSLPLTDTLKVESTGVIKLSSPVRVDSLVDVAKGGSLSSNGNLIMLDQSNLFFTDNGQIVGNILWDREYNSTGWIYFGVPFSNITPNLVSLGGFAQQPEYIKKYVESSTNPRWIDVSNSEYLSVGTGYILAMTSITNDTLVFTGTPGKTPVTVSGLTYTTTNGSWFDYQRGYNLVANPFTAPISVSGFFADNPNMSAIYYWDNDGENNGEFVARTSGGIFSPDISTVTAKNQSKISASYLAPNQAFFVKIPSDGLTTSVLFDTSRITRDLNNNFLKAATPAYLRLYAKNASGTQNDIVFQFNSAVTTGSYNSAYDYYKLISNYYPLEIYSFIDSDRFSIQTLNPDTSEKEIPIGMIVQKAGKHSLWIDNFDAVDTGINVYIYDKSANRYVNLRDSAFTVTLAAGEYDNRFVVIFKKGYIVSNNQVAAGVSSIEQAQNIIVYSSDGQIFANFPEEQRNVTIKVYDMSGRDVYEKTFGDARGNVSLGSNFAQDNVYVVKISGNQLMKVTKVLVQ